MNCDVCGEEIINEPEIRCESLNLCRACAGQSYYRISFVSRKGSSRQLLQSLWHKNRRDRISGRLVIPLVIFQSKNQTQT